MKIPGRLRLSHALACAVLALLALAAVAAAATGTFTTYSLPNRYAGPHGITSGPDGNVWFTEQNTGDIGKITPDGTTETDYTTTWGDPRYIAAGPDGNLWFTEHGGPGAIGRITPAGQMTEFLIPTPFNEPWAITAGPDGNMWFSEDGNKIGRITMAGKITEFPIPTPQALVDRIATAPDGNLWFTEGNANQLARITTKGKITEFALPPNTNPSGIVTGPDHHLWITEQNGPPGAIGRVTLVRGKVQLTSYAVADPTSLPYNIADGPDGNMWFTDPGANTFNGLIGKITTAGVITMFDPMAARNKSLIDITAGPGDGKMWFGLYWSSQIENVTTR